MLAIETSNPSAMAGQSGLIALGLVRPAATPGMADAGCETLAEMPLAPRRRHDDALMPGVARLLREQDRRPSDLQGVGVSIGPGGFTGVRVAVATASMLALSLGIPAHAVPTALVAAWPELLRRDAEASRRADPSIIGVALASKGDEAWLALIGPEAPAEDAGRGRMVRAADLAALPPDRSPSMLIADRHLPEAIRAWAEGRGIAIAAPTLSARACLASAALVAPRQPGLLAPLYPREPEATRLWRQRVRGI